MTTDEFIAWAMTQRETEHYELVAGAVASVRPQNVAHNRMKLRLGVALANAVEKASLPCDVYFAGMAVQAGEATLYEPDVLLRNHPRLDDDAVKVTDPLIVAEILSPSSRGREAGLKLVDYFSLPSLRHYLVVAIDARTVIHHRRDDSGAISTRIVRDGKLTLDPPGIELRDLFG
jgi:Uma2 family endonuclease